MEFSFLLILQIIAFFFLMVPYILASIGKWKGKSYKYIGFNVLGGLAMTSYFLITANIIFFLLNLIWTLGGIIQLVRLEHEKK